MSTKRLSLVKSFARELIMKGKNNKNKPSENNNVTTTPRNPFIEAAEKPKEATVELKRFLFLNERNLYFGRCFIVAKFNAGDEYFLTLKEKNEHDFNMKYKKEGTHNLETIRAYLRDTDKLKVAFDVDPLDVEKIKSKTSAEKVDQIFNVNASKWKQGEIKPFFEVCAVLLKDDGELHMLLNKKQFDSLKINDHSAAVGISLKDVKKLDSNYCRGCSLQHFKAGEDAMIYIFQLDPKTKTAGGSLPDVTHPQPGEDSRPAADVASMDQPQVRRQQIIKDLDTNRTDPKSVGGLIRASSEELLVLKIRHAGIQGSNGLKMLTNTDWNGKILPGTVVDTKIFHPTEFGAPKMSPLSHPMHSELSLARREISFSDSRCQRATEVFSPSHA